MHTLLQVHRNKYQCKKVVQIISSMKQSRIQLTSITHFFNLHPNIQSKESQEIKAFIQTLFQIQEQKNEAVKIGLINEEKLVLSGQIQYQLFLRREFDYRRERMLYIFMKLCPQSFGIFSSLLRQDFSNDAVVQKNMNQHLDGYKIFKKMKKYCQNQQNQIEQLNKALEIEQKAIQQKNESQQLPKLINDHQQSGIKKPFYMFQKRDLLFEIKAEINELEQSLLIKRNHLAYVLYLLNDFKPKKNVQTLLKEYAFLLFYTIPLFKLQILTTSLQQMLLNVFY